MKGMVLGGILCWWDVVNTIHGRSPDEFWLPTVLKINPKMNSSPGLI